MRLMIRWRLLPHRSDAPGVFFNVIVPLLACPGKSMFSIRHNPAYRMIEHSIAMIVSAPLISTGSAPSSNYCEAPFDGRIAGY